MIDKLVKELKSEKKTTARQLTEIKRLNNEIMELEDIVKSKNKKIYDLELDLIKLSKQQVLKGVKQMSSLGNHRQHKERSPIAKD